MAKRGPTFLEEKLDGCIKFLERTLDFYNDSPAVQDFILEKTKKLKHDTNARETFLSPGFRSLAVKASPQILFMIHLFRSWYRISAEERLEVAQEKVAELEDWYQQFGAFIDKLKQNPEKSAETMYFLGGYAEIFFGTIVDEMVREQ